MIALPQVIGEAVVLRTELDDATSYTRAEKAPATRRAYQSDFALFRSWCEAKDVTALPAWPETVAAFLAAEANRGVKASTIGRRMAAIRYAHKLAGHEPPTNAEAVKATLRGIRRTIGAAPVRKLPATADKLSAMVAAMPAGLAGLRDRAVLLLGFAGAFRRSELVALDVADIETTEAGLRICIRKSKTDQDGHGETIAIVPGTVACPVQALKAWLAAASISEGAVFRRVSKGGGVGQKRLTDKSIANIVKVHAARVGLDP